MRIEQGCEPAQATPSNRSREHNAAFDLTNTAARGSRPSGQPPRRRRTLPCCCPRSWIHPDVYEHPTPSIGPGKDPRDMGKLLLIIASHDINHFELDTIWAGELCLHLLAPRRGAASAALSQGDREPREGVRRWPDRCGNRAKDWNAEHNTGRTGACFEHCRRPCLAAIAPASDPVIPGRASRRNPILRQRFFQLLQEFRPLGTGSNQAHVTHQKRSRVGATLVQYAGGAESTHGRDTPDHWIWPNTGPTSVRSCTDHGSQFVNGE